jgi:hypothetical protein
MNEHVTEKLVAYQDGELGADALIEVESHLSRCGTCQVAFLEIQALSALLQVFPAAPGPTPPERFIAQVNMRLPREQLQPAWKRLLEAGWRLVPVGLLGLWTFLQAVIVVSGIVMLTLQTGIGKDLLGGLFRLPVSAPGLLDGLQITGASLSEMGLNFLRIVFDRGFIGWGALIYILLTAMIALMYWGWLASWQIRKRDRFTRKNRINDVSTPLLG